MTARKLACIILAAGKGTRMKSALPKPLHEIAGRSMVGHVIAAAESLNPDKIVVVIGPDMPEMAEAVKPHATAIQQVVNGTGGAALAAKGHFKNFDGDILIVFSDTPLVAGETMQRMVELRRQIPAIGLVYSGFRPADPAKYGRMVMDDDGTLKKIVEFKDATPDEKKITLCNGGIVCADGAKLFDWLAQVGNDNAQKEYYLTDIVEAAIRQGKKVTAYIAANPIEALGINTRAEMAEAERVLRGRVRQRLMDAGVTFLAPETSFVDAGVKIGCDSVIHPHTDTL